ncbi:hypothetical protein CATYP_07065 [Corynebacterium atypicum]|uniref:indole-3-glycerol-phosphate synthase n=1 Tax=Corynebacterium atypicum TaxID=191610 RepID=A0ABM5QNM9_9CORY|nr:indole-3-glycerol phosphate synthase TrpC [Corynebacterium atypicum]AIG64390.1 hypothetical protein CATYP_07065 [Corynebacterium atypicum]
MPIVSGTSPFAAAQRELARREALVPFAEIKALSRDCPPARDAKAVLLGSGCSVIPEIKRSSPSRGRLRLLERRNVGAFAADLEAAGAQIIAVQTENERFAGSIQDLHAVADFCSCPIIARDMFFDPYQVHEARVNGADMVPFHAELLEEDRLAALIDRTENLGMSAIVEARSYAGLSKALAAGACVIGVDARAPETGAVDRELLAEITTGLPEGIVRVALSGVRTVRDVIRYASAGADAVVVGEAVMMGEDPAAVLRMLSAAGQHPACPRRASDAP